MKKRFRILICVLLAGIFGLFLWGMTRPSEPVYEGKSLSVWLEKHVPNTSADPPFGSPGFKKADEALRRIGTNGIPTLLAMIRAHDTPFKLKVVELARKQSVIRVHHRDARLRNEEAEYAFRILETNAAGAVPGLIRIYQERISPSSQMCAALSLGHIGPMARAAVPVLLRNFTDTNSDVRFYAVSAVYHIGGEPELLVPAYTSALKDSNPSVRWNASSALSNLGRRANSAVPELLAALNDPATQSYKGLQEQFETALWRIAPEKVGKPLVIEEATPVISNGVTTEAIKVLYDGQRKTLIPSGRTVPTLTQYWNSDPRPRLAFYRGPDASEAQDHFLGEFEVTDLPASDSLNVSTLCVIADAKIYLCARDNTRQRFLEIRRVQGK
ncbi:MAG: repeat-containing protein [Verrucomicrobiales bacterium]|nr:repeat-containing protein [Verrucomicrobiales bacterium]